MKTPIYRTALSHSWNLAWKHAWLWPLGMFAALLGQMGILELILNVGKGVNSTQTVPAWISFGKLFTASLKQIALPLEGWTWLLLVLFILAAIFVVFIFVAVVCQGALVDMAAKSTKSKKLPDVSKSWHQGIKYFWPVFFINVLKKLMFVVVFLFVFWAAKTAATQASVESLLLLLLFFLLALFVGLVLSFLLIYAIGYIVVEKYKFGESLVSAWKLFIKHPLVSLEVGLIVLLTNIISGLIAIFGTFILFIPAVIFWFLSSITGSYILLFTISLFVGMILSIFYVIFIGSIFTVFATSVWTFLFMEMHKIGIKSKIMHLFR